MLAPGGGCAPDERPISPPTEPTADEKRPQRPSPVKLTSADGSAPPPALVFDDDTPSGGRKRERVLRRRRPGGATVRVCVHATRDTMPPVNRAAVTERWLLGASPRGTGPHKWRKVTELAIKNASAAAGDAAGRQRAEGGVWSRVGAPQSCVPPVHNLLAGTRLHSEEAADSGGGGGFLELMGQVCERLRSSSEPAPDGDPMRLPPLRPAAAPGAVSAPRPAAAASGVSPPGATPDDRAPPSGADQTLSDLATVCLQACAEATTAPREALPPSEIQISRPIPMRAGAA